MIRITPRAEKKLQTLMQEEGKPEGYLRIAVMGGGCSGYQYYMGLEDAPAEDDHVFTIGSIKLVLDPTSAPLLEGLEVDYAEGLTGGFRLNNPNAQSTCGCGQSFSV